MPFTRIDYTARSGQAVQALAAARKHLALPLSLRLLMELRVSQLNGCGYCVDLHSRELIAAGMEPRKVMAVAAWSHTPFFTEQERAALNWAEVVTRLGPHGVPDHDYSALRQHFNEAEASDLTVCIAMMNLWNRLAVALGRTID